MSGQLAQWRHGRCAILVSPPSTTTSIPTAVRLPSLKAQLPSSSTLQQVTAVEPIYLAPAATTPATITWLFPPAAVYGLPVSGGHHDGPRLPGNPSATTTPTHSSRGTEIATGPKPLRKNFLGPWDLAAGARVQIFIRLPAGKTLTINTDLQAHVASLKAAIFNKHPIPVDRQRLLLAGRELQNDEILSANRYSARINTLL